VPSLRNFKTSPTYKTMSTTLNSANAMFAIDAAHPLQREDDETNF